MEKQKLIKYYILCIVMTAIMIALCAYYLAGYRDYFLMPLFEYLYPKEIHFCLICTFIMFLFTAVWIILFAVGAATKKYQKFKAAQIVIGVLLFLFLIISHIMIANYQSKHEEYRTNGIPQGIPFVQVTDLFTIRDDKFIGTYTSYFDTGGPVLQNYMVTQTYLDYSVDTKCVAFSDTEAQENYYYEFKRSDKDVLTELSNKELSILDATTGYYLINNTSYNDIVITFIKGNNVYQITIYGIKHPSNSLFSIIGDSLSAKLLA